MRMLTAAIGASTGYKNSKKWRLAIFSTASRPLKRGLFREKIFRGAAYGAYRAKKCDNVAKCGTNEIFYAKILIMMKFDQRYEKYKAPFGAVEAGSSVRFFMETDRDDSKITLRLRVDGREELISGVP